ncbi:MAG: adenylosuccinate synthetase [Thaumarchaeota archaeon]|nr:adenylosuccinate synthetase [Nitrososphaerota archaeon]
MSNLSVVGLQWGDEGKGKIIDYLAGRYDAVARFNGGSNAGHTVVIGGMKHTFHLIPSGALKGKELLVGAAVALDPVVMGEELSLLPDDVRRRLLVDGRCGVVSPVDKDFDRMLEEMRGQSAIGTTRRGIGPSYALRALRLTPRVSDLVDGFDFGPLTDFYRKLSLDPAGLISWAEDSKKLLRDMVGNVSSRVAEITEKGGSVLFEGSQGTLLDLMHGSYPYVTSTHTTASYIPSALGIPPSMAGSALGVTKCYATRVGGGPFPTEITGPLADSIRSLGKEYGATTGRPRRVGWLDLVALKYAIALNGATEIAVSKLDVLSQVKDFRVCTSYRYQGKLTTDFQSALGHLDEVEPVYDSPLSIHGASFAGGIPDEISKLIDYLEERLKVRVSLVSHGEERSETIEV